MAILPPDPAYLLRGDMGPVHSLLFRVSPYVEHIYAGTESGIIHIWDLKRNREIYRLTKFEDQCQSLNFVNDECLITQRKTGSFNIWNADGSNWILDKTIETQATSFCKNKVLCEDSIFVPLRNSVIGLFSLKSSEIEVELDSQKLAESEIKQLGELMSIKPCVQDQKLVLAAYESGDIALWDLRMKSILSWLKIEQCPFSIDLDETLKLGIVGSSTNKLEVFDIKKNNLNLKTVVTIKNEGIAVVASRPDSKVFTTGGWDGRLRIFSWKSLRPLAVLDQHRGGIYDIAYSGGKVESYSSKCLMAAAGKDGVISLWDLYN